MSAARAQETWPTGGPPNSRAQKACQNHDRSAGKGRQQPERPERSTNRVLQEPGYPGDQRRLIDIAPGRMFSTREVVELITKVSVVGSSEEVENDAHQGDVQYNRCSRDEGGALPDGVACRNTYAHLATYGIMNRNVPWGFNVAKDLARFQGTETLA